MPVFKRAPIEGSAELFRQTGPQLAYESDEPIGDRPRYRHLYVTPDELELLIDAVMLARYPEKAKHVQPLATFDRLADIRSKLEEARQQ